MTSTFFERIDHLSDAVGHGRLTLSVVVDQVYAHYIHEGISRFTGRPLVMHEGGKAFYLRDPLYERMDATMEHIALAAITPTGSDLHRAFIDAAEQLSRDVFDQAPREFGDLRASAHPTVTDNEEVIYDRPPAVHRLTSEELKAKDHVRRLFRFERRRQP